MTKPKVALFAFDTETTGLPEDGKPVEILELSYYLLDGELNSLDRGTFWAFPSDEALLNDFARQNGYSREKWVERGALTQDELKKALVAFWGLWGVKKCTALGHNTRFDLDRLTDLLGSSAVKEHLGYHYECTMIAARFLDRARNTFGGSYSLGPLCARYGIELVRAHEGMADITATVQLYRKLIQLTREGAALPEGERPSFFIKEGDVFKCRRGKHAGMPIEDLPNDYLAWVVTTVKLTDEERERASRVLLPRRAPASDAP